MRRTSFEIIATALVAASLLTAQACGSSHAAANGAASDGNTAGGEASVAGQPNVGTGGIGGRGGASGSMSTTSAGAAAIAGADNPGEGGSNLGVSGASAAGASAAGASFAGASGASVAGASAGSSGAGSSAAGATGASGATSSCGSGATATLPAQSAVLSAMRLSNDYFMHAWPDPAVAIVTDKTRASNIWTRAVYYEGLMALYGVEADATRKASYYDYAVSWGASASHPWQLAGGGTVTRSADNQCCGQTYLDLYQIDPQAVRAHDIKADIDSVVAGASNGDWTWVDAIQMAMPVFAKLGVIYDSNAYFEKMHGLYVNAKTTQGFYNPSDHLWWRDATFEPPFKTPNGKQCYWSRGNGWVFAALTRALDITPESAPYRAEYTADLRAMAAALAALQRPDGFWNVSLADPQDYGGPELTGTALFTYGMAWGIRQGILDRATYEPVVSRAWCALASAVHPNGFLGYAQGSGSQPADGQPVTFDSVPDFQDFPTGCFLLGASEVWKLSAP